MSFGLSCLELASYAMVTCSRVQELRHRELLSELAIIAKACERVPASLDVYFVSGEELPVQVANTLDVLDQLLGSHVEHDDWSVALRHRCTPSLQNLRYEAHRLRRDLMQKAEQRRLILVCQAMRGAVLKEALTRRASSNSGRWLLSRIAGIVFLDTIQLCDHSHWTPPYLELQCHQYGKLTAAGTQNQPALMDRLIWSGQDFERLPAAIHSITIRLGSTTSFLTRQVHTEPALLSRSSSCAGRKKQVIEIQCTSEDLPDCRLWSVVRLIEGESWAPLGVDSQTSHLNFDAHFGRLTSVISDALDQRSPARQVMVRKMLTWAAWSIRPLDSQEMFAAVTTRPQIDILPRCNSNQNENVWPAMDEELISFCPDLLEIRPGGQVTFRHEQLRSLIRSPRSADLAFLSGDAAHESLAAVCLHHLRCTHQETILRPWIKTIPVFRPERWHCPFRSYCTNHWQDHYRAAETSSRGLVAMLHSTLDSALSSGAASRDLEVNNPASRMSMCISICSLWDLKILGRTYLEMGADVDSSFGSNEAPLHVAGANSSTNMVRLLLDRGADSEVRDKSGFTALQQACRVGASDVATLLLEKGADPDSSLKKAHTSDPVVHSSDRTSGHLPVTYGHSDNVRALFAAASNPRVPTADPSSTPLHFAVENGSEYVVRYLLDGGANLEAENALSETALQIAIHERHDSIVKLLIERGAKRATATGQDKVYIDRVIGSEAIDSALQNFQSLSFKDINSSSQGTDYSETNISRLPAIMTPTSRFDAKTIAECGWTMVDKMEFEG